MAQIPNIRHMRKRSFERARYSKKLLAFVSATAARTNSSLAAIFNGMKVPGSAAETSALPNSETQTVVET